MVDPAIKMDVIRRDKYILYEEARKKLWIGVGESEDGLDLNQYVRFRVESKWCSIDSYKTYEDPQLTRLTNSKSKQGLTSNPSQGSLLLTYDHASSFPLSSYF